MVALGLNRHPEDLGEVVEALLRPGGEELDVRDVREIARLLGHAARAMIVNDGFTDIVRGMTEPSPT